MRIQQFAEYVGLKRPFEIQLRNTEKDSATAEYWALVTEKGKIKRHIIRVYLRNIWENSLERDLETIIAHEFIHAWQQEMGHEDTHGNSFRQMADIMSAYFGLPNIYNPELDIE